MLLKIDKISFKNSNNANFVRTVGRYQCDYCGSKFDGVYWHGLNRPIEIIKESLTPRDHTIYRTWERDRLQEKWFYDHDLKLIRVTDLEFMNGLQFDAWR